MSVKMMNNIIDFYRISNKNIFRKLLNNDIEYHQVQVYKKSLKNKQLNHDSLIFSYRISLLSHNRSIIRVQVS